MKTLKEIKEYVEELRDLSWFRCNVDEIKEVLIEAKTQENTLEFILGLIDKEVECYDCKRRLKARIEG